MGCNRLSAEDLITRAALLRVDVPAGKRKPTSPITSR
jgi:hypothetical protein